MAEKIPPPTPEDLARDLMRAYLETQIYGQSSDRLAYNVHVVLGSIIRRCHAAEREAEHLRRLPDGYREHLAAIHQNADTMKSEHDRLQQELLAERAESERLRQMVATLERECQRWGIPGLD